MEDLTNIKSKYQEVLNQLKTIEPSSDWQKLGILNKQKEKYQAILNKDKEIKQKELQLQEAEKILITEKDPKLLSLAKEEKENLENQLAGLKEELLQAIKEVGGQAEKINQAIVEIRAGAGGEEAGLFAADLFNMYSKYAQNQGWQVKVLSSHQSKLQGFKEIIFSITGKNCFAKLKNEAGVHRVQRIPETEKSGRIHTSTASVAVLPRAKKADIKIKPEDLQIDTYKSSGPGGQNVNKRETAIRITHLPTGIAVASQTTRNQAQNKENALSILRAKLLEIQEQKQVEKLGKKRKTQIGQAKRAEKIRTYNFPQNRVTDHRLKKTWQNLQEVMAGNLDKITSTSPGYVEEVLRRRGT